MWTITALYLAGLIARVSAAQNFTAACDQVAQSVSSASEVFYPGSTEYESGVFHSFSSSAQNSTCVVEPGSSDDVAKILSVLTDTQAQWAVKSGGHATNEGFSSTPGVLVAMTRFNDTVYNSSTGLATLGSGARWDRVYTALAPHNVSVIGGRVVGPAVGGSTLNGGYSWLTNQLGLASDNVVEYELVLPTGDIVTVNNTTNTDLFFALKRGGNNYGIATKFTFTTKQQGDVFGGGLTYGPDQLDSVIAQVTAYQSNTTDSKSAMGVQIGYNATLNGVAVTCIFFYDGPSPPSGTFGSLLDIPSVSGGVGTFSFPDLVGSFYSAGDEGRTDWRGVSLRSYTTDQLQFVASKVAQYGPDAFANHSAIAMFFTVEPLQTSSNKYQPYTSAWPHFANNTLLPSVQIAQWTDTSDDEYFRNLNKEIADAVRDFSDSDQGGDQDLTSSDTFAYPHYADNDTSVESLYGPYLDSLRQIQEKYDPKGLIALTGGFKIAGLTSDRNMNGRVIILRRTLGRVSWQKYLSIITIRLLGLSYHICLDHHCI